ncbi:glycosyltransferase family 2 protein [Desulfosediminicola flagellatus]|uniref:glycosyltransferase family 2 protein n=1 Tax=Desulfosediminicola flagellatus TaxID=2569541 RepID=UPI00142EB62A|nr:glycosyltransferase [Desulfosediminicola flagellatus]
MKLSIIIPTYNGAKTLTKLFQVLEKQTVIPEEILVVDSSSKDATVSVCRDYGASVTIIPQSEFDHGGTRTRMAEEATGDILVFMTQDAIPAANDAIEKLIAPFVDDEKLAMTYGRQLPNEDADFAAAHLRAFNYPDKPDTREYDDKEKLGIRTIFTSNSFAAYRKSTLTDVGYFKDGLIFGEDTCAAGRLLQKGYTIKYVSDAAVYHSHNYKIVQEFKRSFDIGVLHTVEALLFNDFGKAENRGVEYVRSGMNNLLQKKEYVKTADFMARTMMKFIGYKAGRNYQKIPGEVVPGLSMHQAWWKKGRKPD